MPPSPPRLPTRSDLELEAGLILSDQYRITQQLGRSEIATSYLAEDTMSPVKASVKLLHPSMTPLFEEFASTLKLASECQHRNLSDVLAWGTYKDHPYIVLEFVRGHTLKHAIERKESNRARFQPRTALSLITPICNAIGAAHARVPHAALTPRNVYVERNGRVRVANLAFGWFLQQSVGPSGIGSAADSPFIAPEVRKDPTSATPLSDIYSLGMIAIALLSGRDPSLEMAEVVIRELLAELPEALRTILKDSVSATAYDRPKTAKEFLTLLSLGLEELRNEQLGRSEDDLLEEPESPGLEEMLAVDELPPVEDDGEDPAVWLIHRSGFDYGPYSSEQVREQLLADRISEFTEVHNLETGERCLTQETDEFAEFVIDYLPVRDERREREAARRDAIQRRVKRASATGVITIVVGLLGLFGFYMYYLNFIRPKPEPIPVESLFAHINSDFRVPDSRYVGISADPEMIASLFNFDIEEEPPPTRSRRERSRRDRESASDATAAPDDYGDVVDFSMSGGNRRLTPGDIRNTITRDASAIRSCFRSEFRRNSALRNASEVRVQFTVRPDGRPVGVDLRPGPPYTEELRSCLVRLFRHMRFPAHDEFALPVTFPIPIRR